MLKIGFAFFNVESIHGFTAIVLAKLSATLRLFVLPSRNKLPPIYILKCIVTTLIDRYKKLSFIRVDEDVALARSSELMRTCHNVNIIFQTTGGDTY